MSANNNDDKSKIDKIREDLEKKLAALERAKLSKDDLDVESSKSELSKESEAISSDNKEETAQEEQSSFLDQISNIENETKPTDAVIDEDISEDQDEAIFEISDEIEEIKKEEPDEVKVVVPPVVENIEKKQEITDNKQDLDTKSPITESVNNSDEEVQVEEEEEEEKSSKLNYLIYGLVVVLLSTVGYFAFGYLKGKNKLDSDKTNKKISELENRRYQDSIKLLEAEKRLEEFESQRYIDSISLADRLKLKVKNPPINDAGNKKNNKKVKAAKPTTTIYKNNKPVVTSKSELNFDEVVATDNKVADNTTTDTSSSSTNNDTKTKTDNSSINEIKDKKDKEIVKEVKKEKKIETLNTIEKAPIYPGCEKKKTERAKKTCMIAKINKFVNKNFNTYVAEDLGLGSGIQRIKVTFIIDRNGYVNILRTRAKHEALKKEAVRVVNKLPRMKPAIKNGKKTQILYNLPIIFSVEN